MPGILFPDGSAIHAFFRHLIPKRRAFLTVFRGAENEGSKRTVLLELAKFCRAYAPCKDKREEGRREVWLHLMKLLKLSDEELTVMLSTLTAEQRYQLFHPSSTFTE